MNLNPDGSFFTGNATGPDTFCLTTDQIGEILAAAMVQALQNFQAAAMFYLVAGIVVGAGAMAGIIWAARKIDERRDGA